MGEATGLFNPAHHGLNALPFFDRINHAGRVMIIGHLALIVLASRGAGRIGNSRAIAALLSIELLMFGPGLVPLPTTAAGISEVFSELGDEDGRVLVLPLSGPGLHPQQALYEQRAHALLQLRLLRIRQLPLLVAHGAPALVHSEPRTQECAKT